MNQKFFDLPDDKQQAVINGGLHVFAKYDYKKASTDEIAAKAGISKGLLFHYFENKKGLYLFLYSYAYDVLVREMSAGYNYAETDFFKILSDAQAGKMKLLSHHPDIMLFLMKAYFEESPVIKPELDQSFAEVLAQSSQRFMNRADVSKFKAGVCPKEALNIVLWMSDGYMRSRTPEQLARFNELNDEYLRHLELLRRQFYRPECL